MKHWVDQNYLRTLNKLEFHIYDRDVPAYAEVAAKVNERNDGSFATLTNKHEIECYLHTNAILNAFNVEVDVTDHLVDGKATPKRFAEVYSVSRNLDGVLSDSKAKLKLAQKASLLMTAHFIRERDPGGEVLGWMQPKRDMVG